MLYFPPDILKRILDNIEGGYVWEPFKYISRRACLSACSYVCKDWRLVAQSLLFNQLSFAVSKPLSQALTFLKAVPHISTHVRALHIWRWEHDHEHQGCGIYPHILRKVLMALPKLQELDLFRVVLLGWPKSVPFPKVPVKLHSLTLTDLIVDFHVRKRPSAQPFDFLQLFEAKKMCISGGELPRSYLPVGDILAVPGVPLPAVQQLKIFGKSLFVELNDKNGGLNPGQLSSLSLEPTEVEQLPFYGCFLGRYGEKILHLTLYAGHVLYRDEAGTTDIWEDLSVTSCTHLKSLRLYWAPHGGYHSAEQDARFCDAYHAILSSTSPHLRELSIVVKLNERKASAAVFAQVAPYIVPVLMHAVETFSDLQRFTLEISDHFGVEESAKTIRGLLPESFVDQGLLHFKANHELVYCESIEV